MRLIVYSIVGVLAVFVISLNVWKAMNPKPADDEDPVTETEDDPKKDQDDLPPAVAAFQDLQRQAQIENTIPRAELETYLRDRITMAEKLLELTDDDTHKVFAYSQKLECLSKLSGLGAEGVLGDLKTYIASLKDVEIGDVRLRGRMTLINSLVRKELANKEPDFQPIYDEMEGDMATFRDDENYAKFVKLMIGEFFKAKKKAEGIKLCRVLLPYYQESENEALDKQTQFLEGVIGMETHKLPDAFTKVVKQEEGAADAFLTAIRNMMADKSYNNFSNLEVSTRILQMEAFGRVEEAIEINEGLANLIADYENESVKNVVSENTKAALARLKLVGKRFDFVGYDLEGNEFDWESMTGQVTVVLVINQQTFAGFSAFVQDIMQKQEKSFRVAAIVTDTKPWEFGIRLRESGFPFKVFPVLLTTPNSDTPANNEVTRIGIQNVPYVFVLDGNAVVRALAVQQQMLPQVIENAKKFKSNRVMPYDVDKKGDAKKSDAKKKSDKKSDDSSKGSKGEDKNVKNADKSKSATDPATKEKQKGDKKQASILPNEALRTSSSKLVVNGSVVSRVLLAGAISLAAADSSFAVQSITQEKGSDSQKNQEPKQEEENPYLAPKHWSTGDLVDFILKVEEKPKSIRLRETYALAVADAADRVLADDSASKTFQRIATLGKTELLHEHACLGNSNMDEKLWSFVASAKEGEDKRLKRELTFLRLEKKLIDAADNQQSKDIEALIAESKAFFANAKTLTKRHLRLASTTVELINRISAEDAKEDAELAKKRDAYFKEFGKLFAKSDDKRMVKYGKYLTKSKGPAASALVGKPLELAGPTVAGPDFDWKAYRKKVVIVDFWATWCGPCRKEMPNVLDAYNRLNAKGFEVVGVSLDDDLDAVAEYVQEKAIPWETLVGPKAKELAQQYGVKGIPTLMLVDRDGNVLAVANRIAQLEAEIEKQFK